jgi:hypothetical protein
MGPIPAFKKNTKIIALYPYLSRLSYIYPQHNPPMPIKSSEIRWFSENKDLLRRMYESLSPQGKGQQEEERIDYYLMSGTTETGFKVREGKHEVKVKWAADEAYSYGQVEHWLKWSQEEEQDLISTLDEEQLSEWLEVRKRRFLKRYQLGRLQKIEPLSATAGTERVCSVEFSTLEIPDFHFTCYSLGIEALGPQSSRDLLLQVINQLPIDFIMLSNLDSHGYPAFLKGLYA